MAKQDISVILNILAKETIRKKNTEHGRLLILNDRQPHAKYQESNEAI